MVLRVQDIRGGRNGHVAQFGVMFLLWNERVLVPYFKEVNALFETDRNVGSLPAVAGL